MKQLSLKAALSGAILMGLTINGAYGQNEANKCLQNIPENVPPSIPLKDNTGDFIHYFLNRDNVPGSLGYKMGELFFAIKQSDKRVQLGKYNNNCWTKIIEVDKKYLIEGLRPLTVGQAAEKFPPLTNEPGVKPGSTLWLRALQKPEYYKNKPLTAPDPKKAAQKEVGLEGLAYRWRHIYAIDSIGGQLWYLVGSQSRLLHDPRKDTNLSKQVLLGWVPAKANQVLATNIGLELNTTKAAVDERIVHKKPVILYETSQTNSKELSKELLEVWNDYKNRQKTASTMAWIEPDGFDPSYPRFYIHGFNPNTGWYRVSTWGSVGDKLKPSDIARLTRQLQGTLDRLRTVDIVVVFDRSGSMSNELAALKQWLIDFSRDLARINAGKTTKVQFLGKDEQFTIGLKINFSLVLFEAKQDYPILKRVRLPQGQAQVINGINSITLQGGYETVFDTLTRVVPTNSGYWENGNFSQRFILVMMDEPGDVGDYGETDVKRVLPLPSQELTKMGYDPNSISVTEWTKIWAVYTESNVAHFRNNVDGFIVGNRLIPISDFEHSRNQSLLFRREMMKFLDELQRDIEGRAKRLGNLLVQEHQIKRQGGQRQTKANIPVTMKLQDAAIQAALKDAGTTLEDLSALVGVAFVDGYLPLKDQARQHPSVQEVVVLEENELRNLRDNVHNIGTQIEKTFQPSALSGGVLGTIMKKVGASNRRERVAISLLYAILAAAGDTATLNYLANLDPTELLTLIKGWLQENADNNIASMMGMQTSIETGSKGLLNLPLKQIVEMNDNTIRAQAGLLLYKSHCMGKILDGRTIPMEVDTCSSDQGIQKRWKYEQGYENYIYVPMRVIP